MITPDWSAPAGVRALSTTRAGGISAAPWASFNLGDHCGDAPAAVAENRRRLRQHLPAEPVWLQQVHGTDCVDASLTAPGTIPTADASISRERGVVCAVLTADCLPILLCDEAGSIVAAVHAGWRGLAAGIVARTLAAMTVPGPQLLAWLGPAIGPAAFEVGDEVRARFVHLDAAARTAFVPHGPGKWLCDLPRLARQHLAAQGVSRITSADLCTVSAPERFFSYRRDGITGRMASLIWLE